MAAGRILVVEDSPDQAYFLRLRLEGEGFSVLTAGGGSDALQLIAAGLVDLVLLDVLLPDMDGYEVCRGIRAWEVETYGHSPVLPVVMVTGSPAQDRVNALEAGADDFLTKPVNQLELLVRVRSLMRIKALHDEIEARNRLLYNALQRSVSEAVTERILSDPERYLRPGGERRVISVLFADLRGYSRLAEELEPAAAMAVLNTYLAHFIDEIQRYGGTVNQLLGDGVMSLFGAPVAFEDHAWRAVQAALDIQQNTLSLEPPGLPHVRLPVGIGVTSGEAVVGHIGSDRRIDFTAVGDVVNLASHLRDQAGPGQILITGSTHDLIEGLVDVSDVGMQRVKGRQEWVQAYSVHRRRDEVPVTA
ncbi:MAG TPA: adenylate/guanylate cyclase domain-containing protein [Chloroflexota bacterium]|nr:adenylate/guanylate cyclase domain-containing protein [Chloroflexota bacterium]